MRDVKREDRRARFVCVLALVGDGIEEIFRGTCEGLITLEARGRGGFGYDPVFLVPETGKTFAEMSVAEKSGHSHRGRALARLRAWISA
jgi:XTP/dITP diphosphohydrolase